MQPSDMEVQVSISDSRVLLIPYTLDTPLAPTGGCMKVSSPCLPAAKRMPPLCLTKVLDEIPVVFDSQVVTFVTECMIQWHFTFWSQRSSGSKFWQASGSILNKRAQGMSERRKRCLLSKRANKKKIEREGKQRLPSIKLCSNIVCRSSGKKTIQQTEQTGWQTDGR
eukprot:Gb_25327 [translate_table: standard]